MRCWLIGLMLAALLPGPLWAQASAAKTDFDLSSIEELPVPADGDKLQQLCIERFNAAVRCAKCERELYVNGKCVYENVCATNRRVILAALELDASPEARLTWLQRHLELAKAMEDRARQRSERGSGTAAELHLATHDRLEAEIQVLRWERQLAKAATTTKP